MSAIGHRLTPGHRMLAYLAELGLYDTTEPHPKLESILESQGVDHKAIVSRTGPLCLRRASIDEATFEIDDDLGEPAFVMAVHDVDAVSVVDLIAWPIRRPEEFATYFGFAAVLGGDAAVDPASFVEAPCPHLGNAFGLAAGWSPRLRGPRSASCRTNPGRCAGLLSVRRA